MAEKKVRKGGGIPVKWKDLFVEFVYEDSTELVLWLSASQLSQESSNK